VLRRPIESGQYAAEPYRKVLGRHGIRQSMSRRGNCLDNAPMESFFASLKKEHVHHVRFRSRAEAKAAVFEYVEIFYNSTAEHPRYHGLRRRSGRVRMASVGRADRARP
jgi:transposase InsO family protein